MVSQNTENYCLNQRSKIVTNKSKSSSPLNILIAIPAGEVIFRHLKTSLPGLHVKFQPTNNPDEISREIWQSCDILYTERTLPEPGLAPNLKWIQFHYAGIDYALQAPILEKPGLQVTTLSGVPALPMGEYTLMMLLALGHRMEEIRNFQANKIWPEHRFEALSPKELRGSTVGIVGYGSTSRQVARLLHAFGARIVAAKHDITARVDSGYTPRGCGDPKGRFVDQLYPSGKLRDMLSICDSIVITVPLSKYTKGMIGRAEFASMKKGAYLINISRGGVVDHTGLIEYLQNGHLGGVALDVFPIEPLPQDDPLWEYPNVYITPHISGYSPNYFEDAANLFVKNARMFLAGKPLMNLFRPELGY